ncbi:hypothetical protein CBR_g40651 [Chara braunii]|uniref:Reverse transcriptase domain-containing protein n=1 Tax=Chara braunii TaxID=69332 RepID=A0A388LUA0_CHABU|nr:hypothetical protein CBR_g40651 [Chara braunii]|eukprot:GBG85841.1 hypothetical protein CBR_g40651 [Chara braunii]
MEKRISEWVANLSLGEEEEVAMYITKDDQEAAMRAWEAEKDVLKRQAMEDEQRMEWKLAMMREKKRRVEAASEAVKELEEVQKLSLKLTPQVDLERKVEILAQSVERLARVQEQQYEFSRSQDIAVRSMRMGFRDFAREMIGAVGAEVNHRLEKTERFCVGAIEGVKVAAPKEEEPRPPRREPVKVKFPYSYSGKREENFENWEANVKTYVHLQQVSPDQHVLIAIHALKDEAASFARSLVHAANCNDDAVAYSSFTSLAEFMKLLLERFANVARNTQLVALFYRAMPEAFRGHFFAKSEDPATTYDSLSREVVAFEAKSVAVSTFWHKDLDKGKQWKGRTISGQVKTKDSLVLTLDEDSVDEIPYEQIEWGLEEEDRGVGQGRTYAAVTAGGRPQGGRGQGQGGRASGSRFQGDQGVGGRGGNRQAGGRGQGPRKTVLGTGLPIGLVKKEKLEEQVFVAYVRPVTEPTEEKSMDPTIAKLLEEFKDLTEPPIGVVPRPIQHRIEIEPGSTTPKGAVYRMSPRELEELRKQLDELLEKGWIRPSSSPFGAPVLFVPKKEGELRMCIDYRGLNAITVKNVEPLPRIDDLLDRVQGAKYFSKIDLKSGYHQIEVHPDDQYKTAFRTRYGHYEFIVMPFGLTNAPATFQRCMNDLFRPWLDKFVVVYLDDILVFSKTLEEHQGHLWQVLEKLREANFKINAKKCDWAKTQVLYLGHVLDEDGVKPEDSKIAAIRDWPTPRTLTELRSFLGLANYYRKFVRNFSTVAAPLRRLLRKETIWKWDKTAPKMTVGSLIGGGGMATSRGSTWEEDEGWRRGEVGGGGGWRRGGRGMDGWRGWIWIHGGVRPKMTVGSLIGGGGMATSRGSTWEEDEGWRRGEVGGGGGWRRGGRGMDGWRGWIWIHGGVRPKMTVGSLIGGGGMATSRGSTWEEDEGWRRGEVGGGGGWRRGGRGMDGWRGWIWIHGGVRPKMTVGSLIGGGGMATSRGSTWEEDEGWRRGEVGGGGGWRRGGRGMDGWRGWIWIHGGVRPKMTVGSLIGGGGMATSRGSTWEEDEGWRRGEVGGGGGWRRGGRGMDGWRGWIWIHGGVRPKMTVGSLIGGGGMATSRGSTWEEDEGWRRGEVGGGGGWRRGGRGMDGWRGWIWIHGGVRPKMTVGSLIGGGGMATSRGSTWEEDEGWRRGEVGGGGGWRRGGRGMDGWRGWIWIHGGVRPKMTVGSLIGGGGMATSRGSTWEEDEGWRRGEVGGGGGWRRGGRGMDGWRGWIWIHGGVRPKMTVGSLIGGGGMATSRGSTWEEDEGWRRGEVGGGGGWRRGGRGMDAWRDPTWEEEGWRLVLVKGWSDYLADDAMLWPFSGLEFRRALSAASKHERRSGLPSTQPISYHMITGGKPGASYNVWDNFCEGRNYGRRLILMRSDRLVSGDFNVKQCLNFEGTS